MILFFLIAVAWATVCAVVLAVIEGVLACVDAAVWLSRAIARRLSKD